MAVVPELTVAFLDLFCGQRCTVTRVVDRLQIGCGIGSVVFEFDDELSLGVERENVQFLRWIRGPLNSGIKNTGGIRDLGTDRSDTPAAFVLVSDDSGDQRDTQPINQLR